MRKLSAVVLCMAFSCVWSQVDFISAACGAIGFQETVELYYRTLCADSLEFVRDQVLPTVRSLGPCVNYRLIPEAKVKRKIVNGTLDCPQGEAECLGNALHACSFSLIPSNLRKVQFVGCFFKEILVEAGEIENLEGSSQQQVIRATKKCAEEFQLDWHRLETCGKGPIGYGLLLAYGELSSELNPQLKWVPTTVIYQPQRTQERANTKFHQRICKKLFKALEFVETLQDGIYRERLARVNILKMKYLPETKPIVPPRVVKMEPMVPIDCFLNISLMRRGFRKCKFEGKPFAKIVQPLYRRESFEVSEGLWKIKDSRLERDSRPKVPRDVLEKAAKFFKVPLDDFNSRLLARLLKAYEEEQKTRRAQLILKVGPCPIWRVSLRQIMDGLEKPLQAKRVFTDLREVVCALTMGRFNVSNWHAPDVRRRKKGKRCWQDTTASPRCPSKTKTWHQVKEYVMFTADPSWHIYCVK